VAASIVGEIQDIHRFKVAKELIAFAGLDPKIRQSGKALNSTDRLTKRGLEEASTIPSFRHCMRRNELRVKATQWLLVW
jgi:transposase